MKKISALIIMLAMAFAASAQGDMYAFYRTYGDKYIVSTSTMTTTSDNCVIFNVELYTQNGQCTELDYIGTMLYKVNCGGDAIDSLFMPAPMSVTSCFRHPTIADATAFTSSSNINDTLFFRILTVSDDLDIIGDTSIPLASSSSLAQNPVAKSILDRDNNITVSFRCPPDTGNDVVNHFVIAKLNLDGEVIAGPEHIETNGVNSRFKGIFSTNPLQYVYLSRSTDMQRNHATVLDENFTVVKEMDLPDKIGNIEFHSYDCHYLNLDDESFALVVRGNKYFSTDMFLLVAKFDHDGNLIGYDKNTDLSNTYDRVWLCATDDNGDIIITMTRFDDGNRYIVVACHDKDDLSVKWERRITDYPTTTVAYDVIFANKTLDNGVTAFLDNGGPNYSIMVLFVEDFAAVDEPAAETAAYLVYPNPASGSISVSVNSGAEIESVSLFDISGRLVKAQQSGFGSIDISGLATGMYVMKVALDDGKVFEEKIVKK
ncbi:MAG: T9SS type A sorting domain-containing protein [Bacteroidales bacterium]|nr:T9SS type A sorting domain-containing protein [Bacteroidales bacterium]